MRSYTDACGITRALDVVGERWAIPVVRELLFGPRRYSDLSAALPGVSTNILGTRLRELTAAGVVTKRRLRPPAAATVYELTPWGEALEPTLIELGRWAAHTPVDMVEQAFSASSFALSLKTTFDPVRAEDVNLSLQLVMVDDLFDVLVDDGTLSVLRAAGTTDVESGPPSGVRIHATPKTMAALVYMGLDPAEAVRTGAAEIEGPTALVATFADCFALPEPPMEGSA